MRNRLDPEKAIEALLYTANRLDGDKYAALKALYHAEKYHLENFGSQIYGETFEALQFGPVPKFAYNITRHVQREWQTELLFSCSNFNGAFNAGTNRTVRPNRDADGDFFSKSDLLALDHGVEMCRGKNFHRIHKESLDDAYRATPQNCGMAIENIVSTLPDGEMINQHLRRNVVDEHDEL